MGGSGCLAGSGVFTGSAVWMGSGGLGGGSTGLTTASPCSVLTASVGFSGVGVLLEDMPTVGAGGVRGAAAVTSVVLRGAALLGPFK